MGFRFRRSVRLFPGVRLNFSRSGISTTVGVRGATVTVGKKGTYANAGIPGTGLSYRTKIAPGAEQNTDHTASADQNTPQTSGLSLGIVIVLIIGGLIAVASLFGGSHQTASPPVERAAPVQAVAPRPTVHVTGKAVNIRNAPSRKAAKVGRAVHGDQYTVFDRSGAWVQIGHESPEGWIIGSATAPN